MLKGLLFSATIAAAIAAPAWAEGDGNPARGAAYATAMCSSCHSVSADEAASTNPAAKPFRTITLADASGEGFAAWLNTKHPNISGHIIKVGQAEDIALFIASLKTSPTN